MKKPSSTARFIYPFISYLFVSAALAGDTLLLREDFEQYSTSPEILKIGEWRSQPVSDAGCLPPFLKGGEGGRYIQLSYKAQDEKLRNGMILKSFPPTSNARIHFSFSALHVVEACGQWGGLFDDEGLKGYVVWWTAGPAPTKGTLIVWKYMAGEPISWITASQLAQLLGKRDPSAASAGAVELARCSGERLTHDSQSLPLAEFVFSIDQKTGEFNVTQDGANVLSGVDDKPIQSLSQVALGGGSGGLFDNIEVRASEQ